MVVAYSEELFQHLRFEPRPLRIQRDISVDGRIILQWILEEYGGKVWTEFILLRIGTSGGLL
jgi:hypothetical protein